jgi:hypothetical protein
MTYSAGSTILDDDYNLFANGTTGSGSPGSGVNNLNYLWGAGATTYGWGQTGDIATVAAGTTITATQWVTLLNRMVLMGQHTGTSLTSITNPSTGDTIAAYSALSGNIDAIWAGRNNAALIGTSITTNGTSTTTSSWSSTAQVVKTITFASGSEARYFFNAGGRILLTLSRTGGSSNDLNSAWSTLLSNVGTLVLTGSDDSVTIGGTSYQGFTKIGGGGSPSTYDRTGAFSQSTTATTRYFQTGAAYLYTSNTVDIKIARGAFGDTYQFGVYLTDGDSDPGDSVDGTLTATWTISQPSTSYISGTWGTPTMNASSWTVS